MIIRFTSNAFNNIKFVAFKNRNRLNMIIIILFYVSKRKLKKNRKLKAMIMAIFINNLKYKYLFIIHHKN